MHRDFQRSPRAASLAALVSCPEPPLPPDRQLRLPLRLPHRRPRLLRRRGRVALPPPLRLAQRLRRAARPRRRPLQLRPRGVIVPISRRYEPGTLVIETTWVTDTGWVVVHDALTIAEWATGRRRRRRRPPGHRARVRPLAAADDDLHRRRGRDGDGVPAALRLRRRGARAGAAASWAKRSPRADDGTELRLTSDMELTLDDGAVRGTREPARGRDRLLRPDLGRRRPRRPAQRPGGAGAARLDRRVLARLAARRQLPRPPLADPPAALGARPQGPHLHPDRGDRRRPDHLAAGDAGRRTQLGLPLQLDPRLDLQPLGPAHARLRPGGARLHALHRRRLPRPPGPADHVRDRRARRS